VTSETGLWDTNAILVQPGVEPGGPALVRGGTSSTCQCSWSARIASPARRQVLTWRSCGGQPTPVTREGVTALLDAAWSGRPPRT